MAGSRRKHGYKNLLRFYRLALPYWKSIVLSLVAMAVYSAVSLSAVLLLRPTVAAFEKGRGTAEGIVAQPAPGSAAGESGPQEQKVRIPDFFQKVKTQVRQRVMALPPVRAITDWLWAVPSLSRVAFILAVVIGPLLLVSGFLQEYWQERVVWSLVADLRVAVFDRLSGLSLRYFSEQRTGELLSRLTNDISRTEMVLKAIFGKIALQALMLICFAGGAVWLSPQLSFVAMVASPVVLYIMWRYGRRIRRYASKTLERLADVTHSVTQMLNGIRVVKAFNMEEAERRDFRARNQAQLMRAFKLVRTQAWAGVLPEFFIGVAAMSLVLLVADHLLAQGKLTLVDVLPCLFSLALAGGRVRRIVRGYNELEQGIASVDRVFELIDTKPDIEDTADAVELDGVHEGVQFSNVWFAYDQAPVLRGIDLFVPCGMTYAIVGETGAGKSTMLDLVPRFYDALNGAISIDGVDVRRIKRKSLMRQIAIVGQRPFLFNRPIAENIRYGKPEASDEEVFAAAKAANIHDFIMTLPEGYQTSAGEAGDRLSGGQRQCITIARAILKNAPILILDEATSSLDAESELLVQQALGNLMLNRTTFVIAHRLSTVRHADQIVVLKDGRIVEQGTHEELLQRQGEYQRLYRIQFADRMEETDA